MVEIQTIDESTVGEGLPGPKLMLPSADITVKELIEFRVRNEVDRYNRERPERFVGLVQPSDVEQTLNGPKKRAYKPIDPNRQVEVALDAFRNQRILVLTPKGQAESLDETLSLFDGDEVSFLRLVPLVGG